MAAQPVSLADRTHIYVQEAVAVDVGHRYASAPICASRHAGRLRNVLKCKIALVQVQPVSTLTVPGKINIRQTVIIDISYGYTSAIIIIEIVEYIELFLF